MTTTDMDSADAARPVFGNLVVWLLAVMVLINYVDRGTLSTAGPMIRDELKLSNSQLGVLLSAFYWTYVPAHAVVGWLTERFNAYWVLAVGLAVWATATALTGLAHGFALLLVLRLLLGVGESAAFPCSSKLFGQHLPAGGMGFANGLFSMGLALGPAFGVFFGGEIMAQQGWRMTFILFGGLSLLWLVPWLMATRRLSGEASRARHDRDEPSFAELLSKPALWGTMVGHGFNLYAFYFVISWLPTYLIKVQGLSLREMAVTGGEIYLVYAASSFVSGWCSDRLIAAGVSLTWSRKPFLVAAQLIVAAAMAAAAFGGAKAAVASLFVAGAAFGMWTPNLYAVAQTLAGPRASGKWVGLSNGVANLSGVLAPLATGFLVDATGGFLAAFAAAGAMALLAAVCVLFLIWRVRETAWAPRGAS